MVVSVVVMAVVVMVMVVRPRGGGGVGGAPGGEKMVWGTLALTGAGVGVETLDGFGKLSQFLHQCSHVVVGRPQPFLRQGWVQVLGKQNNKYMNHQTKQ